MLTYFKINIHNSQKKNPFFEFLFSLFFQNEFSVSFKTVTTIIICIHKLFQMYTYDNLRFLNSANDVTFANK